MLGDDDLHPFVHRNRRRLAEQLAEWVRIPSIAGDPDYADALPRSANYLAGLCRAVGFPRVEVWQQGGTEAVFAEWRADVFAPTVLVYSHHDVRAVTGEPWRETHPFTPVARDGCLYGRGASDAKGQVIAHLWGLRAHLAAANGAGEPSAVRAPSVTMRLLVEGEEELGSPHLEALLAEHADDLACDLVVYSNTTLLDPDRPAVTTSVRGMIGAELTVFGPDRDVHSGAVSGPAPNPAVDLAALVARLHDADGRVTLPGFYAPVTTPTPEQHEEYAALGVDDGWWLEESGTARIAGEHGYTVPELLWARPALEVISMTAGDVEDLHRTVIPASATAALDIRLVDGQSPEEVAGQLERWVAAEARGIRYELSISRETAEAPYRTPQHPAVEALADAMRVGFGVDTVARMGNAGGGPAELLASTLDAPLVFFGTGLVSDRWHAADERVRLDVLERGAATLAAFWPRLAEAMATGVRTGPSDVSSAAEASDAPRSSDTTATSHSSDTTAAH
jgi:acetylornithine deacetylase/succinyl-diaminopimelate desuccinylase-like protein